MTEALVKKSPPFQGRDLGVVETKIIFGLKSKILRLPLQTHPYTGGE